MPEPLLFESKADRGMLRCRLCAGRLIPLGAVARHAARHIGAGEAIRSSQPAWFGYARRWALTPAGAAHLTEGAHHG
jgi:hypothetical protein